MSTFKKAKVVMLPTNNDGQGIYLSPITTINKIHYTTKRILNSYIAQHLYIISDDEIKEGDWCYDLKNNCTLQAKSSYEGMRIKKIIATTDPLLKIEINGNRGNLLPDVSFDINLPQPSQQFIEKYIEAYNKGQQITECLVEYEEIYPEHFTYNPSENIITRLKVDKNNTITIKKVKDSYSR